MFSKSLSRTALVCLLCMLSSPVFAQIISGTITDAQTGEPLPGANIVQIETSRGTSAGPEGNFILSLIESAPSQIKVSFLGYHTMTLKAMVKSGPLDIQMSPQAIISNEVFVRASRADDASPLAHQTLSRSSIEQKNMGQDMPYLLDDMTSVTTTSDAGAGVGYTSMRIRGVDQGRINVTVNGIPINDAESHGVFWVNMPDLASSVENIQVQRGVGTSTNGAAAFGATMNIQTSSMRPEAYGEVNTAIGSFNTRKANVLLGSGLMDNGWQFEGRLSKITSDGYIDRAFSDLKSFYLSGARHGDRSLLRADVFSGKEKTYQAWFGISGAQLKKDRRYNPSGMERPGEPYENQTDNYQQDHYQLHYFYRLAPQWNANASLHYTYGRGYYEEYKADQGLAEYNISPIEIGDTIISQSDLIRRLWLNNHFYGAVFSTEYKQHEQWSLTAGGGYNEYEGDHFGKVIWSRFAGNSESDEKYYDNKAFKKDFNIYVKGTYQLLPGLQAFADAQIRRISYTFLGKDRQTMPGGGQEIVNVQQKDVLTFFNPKAGLSYQMANQQRLFASLSIGHKEPTRDEYVNSTPVNRPHPEKLYDWEAGYKGAFDTFSIGVNAYFMSYRNQLILTGQINDVGAYIRQNVPESYRTGVELQANLQLHQYFRWKGNATWSRNKIKSYTYFLDNYDTGRQEQRVYEYTKIAFSPDFIGNSTLQFIKDNFSAEWGMKYVSRQYLDNTANSRRSLDPYLVNDVQLRYQWTKLALLKGLTGTLQINNVFNHLYESNGYTYGYISEGNAHFFNYYYPQAGRNFLVQLTFKF